MFDSSVVNPCALVLGAMNGYSILKELHEQGVTDLALFDTSSSLSRHSNKIKYRAVIDHTPEKLLSELEKLRERYSYIVIFPTDDLQIVNLHAIYKEVNEFCYLPFNKENIIESLDKNFQYRICEKAGVPYPKSISVKGSRI